MKKDLLSIAYYEDKTSYFEFEDTKDILIFDKNSRVEDKSNYSLQKNRNIALSIKHKIFDLFFKKFRELIQHE